MDEIGPDVARCPYPGCADQPPGGHSEEHEAARVVAAAGMGELVAQRVDAEADRDAALGVLVNYGWWIPGVDEPPKLADATQRLHDRVDELRATVTELEAENEAKERVIVDNARKADLRISRIEPALAAVEAVRARWANMLWTEGQIMTTAQRNAWTDALAELTLALAAVSPPVVTLQKPGVLGNDEAILGVRWDAAPPAPEEDKPDTYDGTIGRAGESPWFG